MPRTPNITTPDERQSKHSSLYTFLEYQPLNETLSNLKASASNSSPGYIGYKCGLIAGIFEYVPFTVLGAPQQKAIAAGTIAFTTCVFGTTVQNSILALNLSDQNTAYALIATNAIQTADKYALRELTFSCLLSSPINLATHTIAILKGSLNGLAYKIPLLFGYDHYSSRLAPFIEALDGAVDSNNLGKNVPYNVRTSSLKGLMVGVYITLSFSCIGWIFVPKAYNDLTEAIGNFFSSANDMVNEIATDLMNFLCSSVGECKSAHDTDL